VSQSQNIRKLPTRRVCERYAVSERTVARWERDPDLAFPQPELIRRRKYYDEALLNAWDRANATRRGAAR
jgi:hypothetical protein